MRRVFADTVYWVALANPLDQWHRLAVRAGRTLSGMTIVTSEEALTEFLASRGVAAEGSAADGKAPGCLDISRRRPPSRPPASR